MSSRLVKYLALILLIVDVTGAYQSPVPSPAYVPRISLDAPPRDAPSPAPKVPDYITPVPSRFDPKDCPILLLEAVDCLTYVEEGSNLTTPDENCCVGFRKLVNTNAVCMCDLLKEHPYGMSIDMKRAMAVPDLCKVKVDPNLCPVANGILAGAPGSLPTDGLLLRGAALAPPPSMSSENGAGGSPSTLLLVAVAAFAWNML